MNTWTFSKNGQVTEPLELAAAKPENANRIEAITQAVKQFQKNVKLKII